MSVTTNTQGYYWILNGAQDGQGIAPITGASYTANPTAAGTYTITFGGASYIVSAMGGGGGGGPVRNAIGFLPAEEPSCKEAPCPGCGKNNDVGVAKCWWCEGALKP